MKALVEYAKASYGGNAELRRMSQQEEHEFKTTGIELFKGGR